MHRSVNLFLSSFQAVGHVYPGNQFVHSRPSTGFKYRLAYVQGKFQGMLTRLVLHQGIYSFRVVYISRRYALL